RVVEERGEVLVVEPGGARTLDPALQRCAQRLEVVGGNGWDRVRDERPLAATPLDETAEVELAIGLQHCVWVDRERTDDFLDGRQLVSWLQDAEPERLRHLLHELEIGRHPGAGVQMKLDHLSSLAS